MDADEDVSAGMRRIVMEQLSRAVAHLRADQDHNLAIFEARKRCKKARTALRLSRNALSEPQFRKSNRRIGAANRSLSALRDAHVLMQTVELLRERAETRSQHNGLDALGAAMNQQHQTLTRTAVNPRRLMSDAATKLDGVNDRIARWPIRKGAASAVRAGYTRIYAVGQDMFRGAYKNSDDDTFHDWRKRVKDYWYSSRILRSLWPSVMQLVIDDTGRLARTIGEDHDLSVLEQTIATARSRTLRAADRRAVQGLIARERERLHDDAWVLGARHYAERPKSFHARIRSYWRIHMDDRCRALAAE